MSLLFNRICMYLCPLSSQSICINHGAIKPTSKWHYQNKRVKVVSSYRSRLYDTRFMHPSCYGDDVTAVGPAQCENAHSLRNKYLEKGRAIG